MILSTPITCVPGETWGTRCQRAYDRAGEIVRHALGDPDPRNPRQLALIEAARASITGVEPTGYVPRGYHVGVTITDDEHVTLSFTDHDTVEGPWDGSETRPAHWVRILRQTFRPEDVHEGEIAYRTNEWEWYECEDEDDESPVDKAVEVLTREGAICNAGHWYSQPDGAVITDYTDGTREEITAFLYGFNHYEMQAIDARLSRRTP